MSTDYTVVIEKDEDGYYVGSVPILQGCHTQGTSIDQLLERVQEAIALWLEVEGKTHHDRWNWSVSKESLYDQTPARDGCPCGPVSVSAEGWLCGCETA